MNAQEEHRARVSTLERFVHEYIKGSADKVDPYLLDQLQQAFAAVAEHPPKLDEPYPVGHPAPSDTVLELEVQWNHAFSAPETARPTASERLSSIVSSLTDAKTAEALTGDLAERYEQDLRTFGPARAQTCYWGHASATVAVLVWSLLKKYSTVLSLRATK